MDSDQVNRLVVEFATQLAIHHSIERGDSSISDLLDRIRDAKEDGGYTITELFTDTIRMQYLEPAELFVKACVDMLEEPRGE